MGLTKPCNSTGLSLEFDEARHHHSPGDVISGRVNLSTASETAIGNVAVSFWGRAKSRIIQQHGQSATTHRGRTQYFHQQKTLYEGQYTHKAGFFSWPFEFVVPDRADPVCIRCSDKWKPKEHYRSTQDLDLNLTLPATMFHKRYTFGRQADCFIEYVLEAVVTEPEGLHTIRKPQTKVSKYPVVFHPLSTPKPIQDYRFTEETRYLTISTLKLLPEYKETGLGMRDLARSIFQKDSLPRFSFWVMVEAPTLIQLFHPENIPFRIRATPDTKPGRTTVDHSTGFPEVVLKSAKIELKAFVRCRAPGTYSDNKTYDIPLLAHRVLNEPLQLTHGSTTAAEATVDLGRLCNLRLGNAKLGSRLEGPLCPSFTGYNVSRTYLLTWELEVECADKTEKIYSSYNTPECTVIMQPATTHLSYSGFDQAEGTEMTRVTSGQSTGSGSRLGWWSSRRRSGEPTTNGANVEMKKEKPTFGAFDRTPGTKDSQQKKNKQEKVLTKEEEAAQDRACRIKEQESDEEVENDGQEQQQQQFYPDTDTDTGTDVEDCIFTDATTLGLHGEQAPQPPPSSSPPHTTIITDIEADLPPPRYVP
ncbi:hypothetical protein A1O1_06742 [Capronia coronata CBS 617.96]|uniref:Arrestin-like N-terminal domain-containing protein n=1 Tax=Capronia coronata CBS 617.96 TaxID=1182541 RepID=W9XSA8_9EURO|nr:uncharacterized protein A1O1_06742 [Capronia coronata CBS 617.96]EXJ83123.1 hypothetical protein A1O1_06742 [Capronia coronata CBS 617.96]